MDYCINCTRRAASWFFHSEEIDQIIKEFPSANLLEAKALADLFSEQGASYDEAHVWSLQDLEDK